MRNSGKKVFVTLFMIVLLLSFVATEAGPLPLLAEAHAAAMYHGNKSSHVFHRPGCRYYGCKNCVVVFTSREQALAEGFRPCKICRP